jgi:hypothetical protein
MAEGDEERAKRDGQWEQQKQRWKEEDERDAQLLADIQALLKKVQGRHKGKDGDDDDDEGIGVRVLV